MSADAGGFEAAPGGSEAAVTAARARTRPRPALTLRPWPPRRAGAAQVSAGGGRARPAPPPQVTSAQPSAPVQCWEMGIRLLKPGRRVRAPASPTSGGELLRILESGQRVGIDISDLGRRMSSVLDVLAFRADFSAFLREIDR